MIWLLFFLTLDPRYHTRDQVAHELDSIARHFSSITMLDTIGYSSFDSVPLFALKISDNPLEDEDEPAVLYIGCHHAEEILGIEICLYMIAELTNKYATDSAITYLVDNREIWFVPLMNPDGHDVVMAPPETTWRDTTWRDNKRDNNKSGFFELAYDGVDLNRNYDFYWTEGGSTDPTSEFYKGPHSFSENETRAIRDLAIANNFTFCITYHSARYGLTEVVYFPWYWEGGYSPDFPCIRTIADSISKRIVRDSGIGYYNALPGEGLDGRARNWLYGVCGIFTYCIEVSTTTIPPGSMVDDICHRNLAGAYYLLERVSESGITGLIYDSLTGEPLNAEVVIHGYYDPNLPPRRSDPRYGRFLRLTKPGTYDIEIRKHGYATIPLNDIQVIEGQLVEFNIPMTRISGEKPVTAPQKKIKVSPNPSSNNVLIELDGNTTLASLRIYDITGRLVKSFENPGYSLLWQGLDDQNRTVAGGIYWLLGKDEESQTVQKIILIKGPVSR
jgi:carboxypeptidase T